MNHYETHLTLTDDAADKLAMVSNWAAASKLKWTQIVLDVGETPMQPMVTFWGSESLENQLRLAEPIVHQISELGCSVMRIKIEANIENDEVPKSDLEAHGEPTRYFEHHVKVLLSDSADLKRLTQRAVECEARLSQNIRRRRPDGKSERFVTQRIYGRGRVQANESLTRLLKLLSNAEFQVLEVEEEYVVYDSNIAVDSGWLNP